MVFFILSIVILKMLFRIFSINMYLFLPILIFINILKVYLGKEKYLAMLDQRLLEYKLFQNFILHCMVLETWLFHSKHLNFFFTYILVVFLNVCALNGYFTIMNFSFHYFMDIVFALVFMFYCVYFDLRWRFLNYYNLQLEGPWVYWNDLVLNMNKVFGVQVKNQLADNIPLALFSLPYSQLAKLSSPNTRSFTTIRETIKELIQLGSRNFGAIGKIAGGTTMVGFGQWEYNNRLEALKAGRSYSASLDPTQYRVKMKETYKEMLDISKEKRALISNQPLINTPYGKEELQRLSVYEAECDKTFRLYAANYIETAIAQGAAIRSNSDAEENFWSFKFVPGKGLVKVKFENPYLKAQNVLDEVRTSLNTNDMESLQSFLDHSPSEIREVGENMARGMSFPRIMNEPPASPPPPTALSLGHISWIEIIFS